LSGLRTAEISFPLAFSCGFSPDAYLIWFLLDRTKIGSYLTQKGKRQTKVGSYLIQLGKRGKKKGSYLFSSDQEETKLGSYLISSDKEGFWFDKERTKVASHKFSFQKPPHLTRQHPNCHVTQRTWRAMASKRTAPTRLSGKA